VTSISSVASVHKRDGRLLGNLRYLAWRAGRVVGGRARDPGVLELSPPPSQLSPSYHNCKSTNMTTTAPSEAPQTFDPQAFDRDEADTIFLLTSLTSGSSSIITATSRLEHILKSNKVAFKAVDLATDDKARRLWQWKGKGKRLPGVAKNGEVLGVSAPLPPPLLKAAVI
jgi:hypothetical protein